MYKPIEFKKIQRNILKHTPVCFLYTLKLLKRSDFTKLLNSKDNLFFA
jgi:hypothetical protein